MRHPCTPAIALLGTASHFCQARPGRPRTLSSTVPLYLALSLLCTHWDALVQEYLAHKKQRPPRNTPLRGPYSRTLPRALRCSYGGGRFLMSEVPLYPRTHTLLIFGRLASCSRTLSLSHSLTPSLSLSLALSLRSHHRSDHRPLRVPILLRGIRDTLRLTAFNSLSLLTAFN